MEWIKKIPTWISSAIGLITLIIGFVVLLLDNTYLGITISVVFILFSGLGITIYLLFSKKDSGIIGGKPTYRFPKYRRPAILAFSLIIIFFVLLPIYKPSRSFAIIAFVGTPTSAPTETPTIMPTVSPIPNEVSIASIIIAEREENYRVEVAVYNPFDRDAFVNHFKLSQISQDHTDCSGAASFIFALADEIVVTSVKPDSFTFQALVSPGSEELSGYGYAAQGSAWSFCGDGALEIDFDTSVVLSADSYTAILIDVPKIFKVSEAKVTRLANMENDEWVTEKLNTTSINVILYPEDYENYSSFVVSVELTTVNGSAVFSKQFIEK